MDKARKKYKNVEQLSNGKIFAVLGSVDSDDMDEVDNLINNPAIIFLII